MQNTLTELEKQIYNKHLAVSRSQKNKPFKLKQNFTDIVDTEKHKFLKRISVLFQKHPELDQDTFFRAPYVLYPDVEFFGLDYFSSMRAVKAYTMHRKLLFLQSPDEQLPQIQESLKFIAKFCIEKNMYFHQYPYHRTGDIFTWMKHYKENKINIYSMFEFNNIFSSVKGLAEDVQKFFVSNFLDQFQALHAKYNNSSKTKLYVSKSFPLLSNFVEKQLTQSQNKVI